VPLLSQGQETMTTFLKRNVLAELVSFYLELRSYTGWHGSNNYNS
jgi:hypothetical protein